MKKYYAQILFALTLITTPSFAKLHDPTLPANIYYGETGAIGANAIKVDFVLISKDRKIVSIDGRILSIGDKLRDSTILDITPDHLEVDGPHGKTELQIMQIVIKKYKN